GKVPILIKAGGAPLGLLYTLKALWPFGETRTQNSFTDWSYTTGEPPLPGACNFSTTPSVSLRLSAMIHLDLLQFDYKSAVWSGLAKDSQTLITILLHQKR
ncbi:MAG: hypothetical protein O7C61_07875, partial [SAR324 cluster bacterium]|nr:hypothetical protein [SAR324 cluster bacterium]